MYPVHDVDALLLITAEYPFTTGMEKWYEA